jgi:hypothetical protein
LKAESYRYQRGAALPTRTITHIPANATVRPLRDWIAVEPLEVNFSDLLLVAHEMKPLKGIVKAVGPGTYPKRYDHPEKHKRTKMWDSTRFRPTEIKVGDVVELGGKEIGGYAFETFYWGDVLHLMCREEDIAGVHG